MIDSPCPLKVLPTNDGMLGPPRPPMQPIQKEAQGPPRPPAPDTDDEDGLLFSTSPGGNKPIHAAAHSLYKEVSKVGCQNHFVRT